MMILLRKKIPMINTNPYLGIFFGVSLLTFVFGFLLFTFTYLLPGTKIAEAQGSIRVSSNSVPILEVHIANNGMVYIQGARVLSVTGTTIIASTSWDVTKIQWTINTNGSDYGKRHFGTTILDSKGNKLSIADIRIGDVITISGIFDINYAGLVVMADVIRI